MKRFVLIGLLCVVCSVFADDYVDDVYYSPTQQTQKTESADELKPYYNKKAMQQIIFLDDTLPAGQYADTVRAIIRR